MDKKTLGLLAALGAIIAFFYFMSPSLPIKDLFNFNAFLESSPSGRTTFSDLLETPTPSPSPEPSPTPESPSPSL